MERKDLEKLFNKIVVVRAYVDGMDDELKELTCAILDEASTMVFKELRKEERNYLVLGLKKGSGGSMPPLKRDGKNG